MTPSSVARLKALVAVIVWGASFPSAKVAVGEVSFTTLVWLRFGSGLLVLFLFLAIRRKLRLLPLREAVTFAALGFLDLGAQLPSPEWGAMLGDALELIYVAPWTVMLPGAAIMVSVLLVNLLGDGIRRAIVAGVE